MLLKIHRKHGFCDKNKIHIINGFCKKTNRPDKKHEISEIVIDYQDKIDNPMKYVQLNDHRQKEIQQLQSTYGEIWKGQLKNFETEEYKTKIEEIKDIVKEHVLQYKWSKKIKLLKIILYLLEKMPARMMN